MQFDIKNISNQLMMMHIIFLHKVFRMLFLF